MASGPVAYADSDDEEIAERRKAGGRYSEWLQTDSVYEQGFNIPSGLLRSVDGSALSDDDEQVNEFERRDISISSSVDFDYRCNDVAVFVFNCSYPLLAPMDAN